MTGPLADALNWAGISEDAFNEKLAKCTSTQERERLIRETLNGLYDDAANKYEENAAGILASNEAQIKLNEQMAVLGEAVAPINTMLAEFATTFLEQLTPILTEFAEEHGPKIKEVLEELAEKIGNVLNWVIDNWDLISTIGTVILVIAAALSVFSTVMGIVNAVMLASPVTWIVLAIVAALAAVVAIIVVVIKHWDWIKEKTIEVFNAIKDKITEKINQIKAFVKAGIQLVKSYIIDPIVAAKNKVVETFTNIKDKATEKINALKDKIKEIVDKIKGFFNFEFKTPKLKTPKFGITPEGWKVGDLLEGVIPKLSIKWNAEGGVFTKPTLTTYNGTLQGLAEKGAEAIVPLEKNTEWLDKIANKLIAKQNNTPIVLNVDGKEFARTSINTINNYTRQTGSLGLNII